jgi:hypothetical protein
LGYFLNRKTDMRIKHIDFSNYFPGIPSPVLFKERNDPKQQYSTYKRGNKTAYNTISGTDSQQAENPASDNGTHDAYQEVHKKPKPPPLIKLPASQPATAPTIIHHNQPIINCF